MRALADEMQASAGGTEAERLHALAENHQQWIALMTALTEPVTVCRCRSAPA